LGGEGYGHAGPFDLSDGAFDSYVIYFSEVISVLSFGLEVGVAASNNYKDCAMGGKASGCYGGSWICGGGGGLASALT
jgi:hypothetical protein